MLSLLLVYPGDMFGSQFCISLGKNDWLDGEVSLNAALACSEEDKRRKSEFRHTER